jgi:RHS repeat-associated protein
MRRQPTWEFAQKTLSRRRVKIFSNTYTYNSYGEVINYTAAYPAGLSFQISYTRDALGRITAKTEIINGITTTWGYSYDQAGRLIETTKNGDLWASYSYDLNGNRVAKTTQSGTISATYDAQDRLLNYGNYTYSYTANGELETKTDTTTGQTTTYEYDVLGNLKKVVLPDGTLIEYIVDGKNRRVGKKVNGTLQRQWIYDGQLRPVAELNASGTVTATLVYGTHINIPDYIVKSGVTYRVITDHLGSLRFVINTSTGAVAQRMDYDDWGNVLVNTAPDFTPFGFAGGMYDSQTKLTRFGARDYDAEVGRWTTKDPIGFGGNTGNLYLYVENDSVNLLDPEGLSELCFRRFDMGLLTAAYYTTLFPYLLLTGHCYVRYFETSASSYIPDKHENFILSNTDPLSNTPFQICVPITGGECCTEECLKNEMSNFVKAAPYNIVSHNCCDAARDAIDKCGCKEPMLLKIANYGI